MIIDFEGIDGSGKGTQAKMLYDYLQLKGKKALLMSFPNYLGTFFGAEVGKYLNGEFGSLSEIPAKFPAMLYALDRFEMKSAIEDALKSDKIIIFDRYVPSNFAHQAAKLDTETAQCELIEWVKQLEYNILGMPKPDITLFLDVDPEVSASLVLKKSKRVYTDSEKDIHEKDDSYLAKVYQLYKSIAVKDGWLVIGCCDNGRMIEQESVFSIIIEKLKI